MSKNSVVIGVPIYVLLLYTFNFLINLLIQEFQTVLMTNSSSLDINLRRFFKREVSRIDIAFPDE